MRDMRIASIWFEMDCSDLVDMTTNLVDWPTIATEIKVFQRLHEEFDYVNLSHIPRSRNGQVNALAKKARTIGYVFFHIYQI